jgi:hypothetical protein
MTVLAPSRASMLPFEIAHEADTVNKVCTLALLNQDPTKSL